MWIKYISQKINSKNVLKKLYLDEYKILSSKLIKLIRKDLADKTDINDSSSTDVVLQPIKNNVSGISKNTNISTESHISHYNITEIIKRCSVDGIIPEQYDYNKVRQKLSESGIIYIDENNLTVATQKSIDNKWFILRSDKVDKNGIRKRLYYISEAGKNQIIKSLSQYDKNLFLKTA